MNGWPLYFQIYVRPCFRGQNLSEIYDEHVEKQLPLRQADEMMKGKATLLKSDYDRCEHPCDVVLDPDDPDDDRF